MKKISFFSKISMVAIFLSFCSQSCTNLDEKLYDQVTTDKFFKTDEEVIAAVGAAYTSLYGGIGGHNSVWSDNEVSSDELVIPHRGADWYDGGQWLRMHRHEYTKNEPSFNNSWTYCYGGISTCNRLLYQFDQLKLGDKVTPFIAELKTLRALYYYILLDMFGNVPVVTNFADATPPTTKARKDVYAFIESELLASIPLLSKVKDPSTYARINYYAGQAILAKLYLNAGVYTGTPQWSKAAAAANEIITSGKFFLEGNYYDNFKTDNAGSRENIFVIPYDKVFAQGFNMPQMTLHYSSQSTYDLQKQPWNGYCSISDFYNSYDNADARKKNFLAGAQYSSTGERLVDANFEAADPDGKLLTFTPELNQLEPGCFRQAGVRIGKYEFASGSTENLSNDYPILRYADIVLIRAEALWKQNAGDAEALTLVNSIRSRAGVAPYASITSANLLAERGREMFAEAWRRQDMIRFGTYTQPFQFKAAVDDACKIIFPIPNAQINANSGLTQNPCY